jgi:hypothetical protein
MSSQRYYSTVYWHFTGSPKGVNWDSMRKRSDIKANPKPPHEAVEIMMKILESQKLLATAKVKITEKLTTEKFCCVTDIPLKDLPLHSEIYGNVALGFRAAAIYNQFLPVFYISQDFIPPSKTIITAVEIKRQHQTKTTFSHSGPLPEGMLEAMFGKSCDMVLTHTEDDPSLKGYLSNYIKITDYSVTPNETFYCEREWRKVGEFCFKPDDVAVIVVPEAYLGRMRKYIYEELEYPATVSLIAWELIEQV